MNSRGLDSFDGLVIMGLFVIFAIVVIPILTNLPSSDGISSNEFNAKFLCGSHQLELLDYDFDGSRFKEVKCFKENQNIKVFKARVK